jgi:hypothetical protein
MPPRTTPSGERSVSTAPEEFTCTPTKFAPALSCGGAPSRSQNRPAVLMRPV